MLARSSLPRLALGLVVTCSLAAPAAATSAPGVPDAPGLRTQSVDVSGIIDANDIGMVVTNVGSFAFNINQAQAGLEYPRGTGHTAVFAGGLWLAGISDGALRVAVAEYGTEYQPGAMIGGSPDDPAKPEYKVYKLKRNYASAVERDAALYDYNAGAVPHGAPRVFVLLDGSLSILGDQMLWSIQNDAEPLNHTSRPGSTAPLGVEVRQTTYAYATSGSLGSVVFLRFEITNGSPYAITDMYPGIWSDPDVGGFTDDLVGCDPARDLGYCYNATNNDLQYGTNPPAVGFDLLQTPLTSNGPGFRSAASLHYTNGTDPISATETYNRLRGLLANGDPVVDPTTAQITRYAYTGNPVAGTGWLDASPEDKRLTVSSGPFVMEPGETLTISAAIVIGRGSNRLSSITILRAFDDDVQAFFDGLVAGVDRPGPRRVEMRVWPNPGTEFALGFSLVRGGRVRATVHDLVGRQVALVADEEHGAGPHLLHWDGRLASVLSGGSGVYWMKLETPEGTGVRKIVRLE